MRMKAFLLACLGTSVVCADPIEYWFTANVNGVRNNAISASGAYRLAPDGTTGVDWVDGNWFCVYTAYTADWLTPAVSGMDPGSLAADITIRPYGIKYGSGGRNWNGSGRMEIGAGGFTAPRAWDAQLHMNFTGGLHLTADQMWDTNAGIDFNLPVTTEDGITWTMKYDNTSSLGQFSFQKANDLSGCDIVLTNRAKLVLSKAAATVKAKSLTISGANTYVQFDSSKHALTFGPDYAERLILADGASLKSSQTFEGVTLDFDSITVLRGTSTIGDCDAYYVANGGTQPVTVESGATLNVASGPASGRLVISGGGRVLTDGAWPQADFSGFSGVIELVKDSLHLASLPAGIVGTVRLSGTAMRIDDMSAFTGNLEISDGSTLMLPATGTWGTGATVTTIGDAKVYLPAGVSVDSARFLGTANYAAAIRGLVTEPAGTITVGAGEKLLVGGDGFTADTSIALEGGMIYFLCPATIASPLSVTSASKIGSALCVTGTVSGAVSLAARLTVSNDYHSAEQTSPGVYVWRHGRVRFTGRGSVGVDPAELYLLSGEVEFNGAQASWSFAGNAKLTIYNTGRRMLLTDGARLSLSDGSFGSGFSMGSTAAIPCILEIASGATLDVGRYRSFDFGGGFWRSHAIVLIDGGTLRIRTPDGRFNPDTWERSKLKNDTADRCAMSEIKVVNGGVLETDRVFAVMPVTHTLDGDYIGERFESGAFITLDGGTYKLGSGFGRDPSYQYPTMTANYLFAGLANKIGSYTSNVSFEHTADIKVTIGANGGTFDFSDAKTNCSSFTNTVTGKHFNFGANSEGAEIPCRGPRWELNGPLTIKGNGAQEFVMNSFTNGQLTEVVADGMVGVVVNTNATAATLAKLTLGAPGGGLRATDAAGTPKTLAIDAIDVLADGTYSSAPFDAANTTVGTITFAEGSTLAASSAALLPVSGVVTLASVMQYFAPAGVVPVTGAPMTVLTAGGGVQTTGTTWLRGAGSARKYVVDVGADRISFAAAGFTVILR